VSAPTRTFTTERRDPDGTRTNFNIEARTWEEAEALAAALNLGTVQGPIVSTTRIEDNIPPPLPRGTS
jgi:hypothetical protein